jgi:hypothetical protein
MAIASALLLLTGCDGYLKIDGRVVDPTGKPVGNIPVYFFSNGKADEYDGVLWADESGKFSVGRIDCPCDFPVELIAVAPNFGIGRQATTHKALEKNSALVIRLTEIPKAPVAPSVNKAIPVCPGKTAVEQAQSPPACDH